MEELVDVLSKEIDHSKKGITAAINLFEQGKTLHFIARYRKDATQGLDDEQLQVLQKRYKQLQKLNEAKVKALQKLQDLGRLSDSLLQAVQICQKMVDLEDIMAPFKSGKNTRAGKARDIGLQPLADHILGKNTGKLSDYYVKSNLDEDDQVNAALDIVAEEIVSLPVVTQKVTNSLKSGRIEIKDKAGDGFDRFNSQPISKLKSHQILALLRAEYEKKITIKFPFEVDKNVSKLMNEITFPKKYSSFIERAMSEGLKRLLIPRTRNRVKNDLREQAEKRAIEVFKKNLENLLVLPPIKPQVIIGIDPGYVSGCKYAVIEQTGDLLDFGSFYPTPPREDLVGSAKILRRLIKKYDAGLIAIGNGTASRETSDFVQVIVDDMGILSTIVSEDGASVYSASAVAREEFPELNTDIRGAISIARRVLDPLAEYVKIEPKSLGVGQYQHDVNQKELKEALDFTMSKVVNTIGVNLETASKEALSYIAGITPVVAKNIVDFRESTGFGSLNDLKNVKRLGDATFEQCVGFLRYYNSTNPFDQTMIHPENYEITLELLTSMGFTTEKWINVSKKEREKKLKQVKSKLDELILKDIKEELILFGEDPRGIGQIKKIERKVKSIDELEIGMELEGTITNILDFGAFVDFGIKENGLIHISNISEGFVSDIYRVVKLNEKVKVKILTLEAERKRIGLKLLEKI